MSSVRHWLGAHNLRRENALTFVMRKVLDRGRGLRQPVYYGRVVESPGEVGLSPFAKKADVLGLRWEQGVEFWQYLFLTIVRSE